MHRCAVCWEQQMTHPEWFEHATSAHGAALEPFDYDVCEHTRACRPNCRSHIATCPGIQHAKRLPNFGAPVQRRAVDRSQPIKARDGTVYTPIPLFPEAPKSA